jgi:L-proline amide hydrolase
VQVPKNSKTAAETIVHPSSPNGAPVENSETAPGPRAEVREGFAPFGDFRTWYRVTGDIESGKVPLIIAHGGPGCTHDYVDSFKDIAASGRAVIHYDQIGNGRSSHVENKPPEFWTVELFLSELENLTRHLGIDARYNLLGQSWGGMLAAEHAVRGPRGLNALVIASSPSSMTVWLSEALRLRASLPIDVQETLALHEANEAYHHAEYLAATDFYYRRHVCRLAEWPDEVRRSFAAMAGNPTVYHTMNGPTEFHITGTLKDWSIDDRLHKISVPTLLISGVHDEATAACVAPYASLIPNVTQVIMTDSAHMCHVEERDATMETVERFLTSQDWIEVG